MSVPLVKFICSVLMAVAGLVIVKRISCSQEKLLSLKNVALMSCLIVLPAIIYDMSYAAIYTVIFYIITIITYKYVLNISLIKSIISCGIMMVFIIVLDFIASIILVLFISANQVRDTWYINIVSNILFSIILLFIFSKTKIKNWCSKFVNNIEMKKQTKILFFFILVIIAMSVIVYIMTTNYKVNSIFTKNLLIFLIFFLLVIILFTERNSYDKLSDQYESLFNYVKVFEDWIEQEQFIRHEYKNQLAVLRSMTKERKVKDKIDSIIAENINIDDSMINEFRNLPNGGLKGLLYYKLAVARNKNVNVEVDVSSNVGKLLKKLNEEQIKVLSKLLGVYCDNAIEAATDTKKKIVSIEIYCFDNIVNFVVSNTFDKSKVISNRSEKGVSTKGKGRGNGLYFAGKLLSKNNWIEEKQDIINDFYIEKISINT